MAVEILILSGARQNDRITLDGREFRVGSDPGCEVFLDPRRDGAIRGRSARFRLQEDGWYVRCAGGEMSINGRRAVGATHVRSGDVIRMSESGPDFSFHIVAGAKASAAKTLATATTSPLPLGEGARASVAVPTASPLPPGEAPVMASQVAQPNADNSLADSPHLRHVPARDRQWVVWVVGGLAAGILTLIVVRLVFPPSTVIVNVGQPGAATPPIPPIHVHVDEPSTPQPPVSTPKSPGVGGDAGETPPGPTKPPVDPAAQVEEAVFLLQAEKDGHLWPFATCVAIGGDTLLTTAREAAQLAKWREERGFKVWVTRQADDFKEEAQDIRVSALFASLADKAGDWIYADLGLLTVRAKLPKIAALASTEELVKVKSGVPVVCVGFAHEGEMIADSDNFRPRRSAGNVFVITGSHDLPGQPRLLHVRAQVLKNAYGSPVIDADGKIIGLYGEAIPESKGLKNLHYVTLVNPEMVDLWLSHRGAKSDKIWLPAAPAPTTPKTPHQP